MCPWAVLNEGSILCSGMLTPRSIHICACLSGSCPHRRVIDMADQRQHSAQTAKKSRGFLKHLEKVFRRGSQSIAPTMTINRKEAAKLRARYTHFRILVIGRANAGKTTLLKRVCNTKEDPVYSKVRYRPSFIPHSYRPFIDRLIPPRRCHLCPFLSSDY